MATENVTQAATGQSPADKSIGIDGWASDQWKGGEPTPSVGTNPDATPLDLVSWAYGQLQQLHILLAPMSTASGYDVVLDLAEIMGAIRHFTEPVQSVLQAVAEQLSDAPRKDGAA